MKRTRILAFYLGCLVPLPFVQILTWVFSWQAHHPLGFRWIAFWMVAATLPATFFGLGLFLSGALQLPNLERVPLRFALFAGAAFTLVLLATFILSSGPPSIWLIAGLPIGLHFFLTVNPLTATLPGRPPISFGRWMGGLIASAFGFPVIYLCILLATGLPAYFIAEHLLKVTEPVHWVLVWLLFSSFPAGIIALIIGMGAAEQEG